MERIKTEDIKRLVFQAGFDLCGVCRAEYLEEEEVRYRRWLSDGNRLGMEYLERNMELRFDASKLVEGARTVVVCAMNYKSEYSLTQRVQSGVAVASYALMRDYHKSVKRRLKEVFRALKTVDPTLEGRLFTDSAPLLEKGYAVRAGLGSVGRQSLIVTPEFGTFVVLGELVLGCEVDRYDEPFERDLCGSCRRCVESCPVGAINPNRTIDSNRCIACRTIEQAVADDGDTAGWIFGCDICQRACPHNQSTLCAKNPDARPIITPPTAAQWLSMSPEDFMEFAQSTPLKRSSLESIQQRVRQNIERDR